MKNIKCPVTLPVSYTHLLDLALGRGGDQVVVAVDGGTQFFGGTTTVTAKSTRVRARIVAHTIHEQIIAADKVFVMGHMMEDFDSVSYTHLDVYKRQGKHLLNGWLLKPV